MTGYSNLTIYAPDGSQLYDIPVGQGSMRVFTLMEDDCINLKCTVTEPLTLTEGDYVEVDGRRFELVQCEPGTFNTTTGGYDYELKFEAQYLKFRNKLAMFLPMAGARETSWKFTGRIDDHAEQLRQNLNCHGGTYLYNGSKDWEVVIAGVDEIAMRDEVKPLEHDSENVIDAISALAEAYECEWWFMANELHLGKCLYGAADRVAIAQGTDADLTRSDSTESRATRIYPFGSDKNLPGNYRKELVFTVTNDGGYAPQDSLRILDPSTCFFNIKSEPVWKDIELRDGALSMAASDYFGDSGERDETGNVYGIGPDFGFGIFVSSRNLPFEVGTYSVEIENDPTSPAQWQIQSSDDRPARLTKVFAKVFLRGSTKDSIGVNEMEWTASDTLLVNVDNPTEGKVYNLRNTTLRFNIPYRYLSLHMKIVFYCYYEDNRGIVNIQTSGKVNATIRSEEKVYWAENLNIYSYPDKRLIARNAVYNSAKDRQRYDFKFKFSNLQYVEGAEPLKTGDKFMVSGIQLAAVPWSYFSLPIDTDEYQQIAINGIVNRRLLLPKEDEEGNPLHGYIDVRENIREEEAIEDVVIFDDIYPSFVADIVDVKDGDTYTDTEANGMGEEIVHRWQSWLVKTNAFDYGQAPRFNESLYCTDGNLSLAFQSGMLNGMTFEAKYSNGYFELIRDSETNLPNEIMRPQQGDKVVFINFNAAMVNDSSGINYIDRAEQQLLEKAREYVARVNIDNSVYSARLYCGKAYEMLCRDDSELPLIGRAVSLVSPVFFAKQEDCSRASRIIGYEIPLDLPYDNPTLSIGEKGEYSRLGAIEDRIDQLGKVSGSFGTAGTSGGTTGGEAVEIVTSNSTKPLTDGNVFSSLRARLEFMRRNIAQTVSHLWTFMRGAEFGEYSKGVSGAYISGEGEAELKEAVVRRKLQVGNSFTEGMSGGAMWIDEMGNAHLQVDFAEVTKKATFAELEIKKLSHVGGIIILSPASMECSEVEETATAYRCYCRASDPENPDRTIANQFAVGDLAQCRTFNVREGTTANAANRYYWRKVVAVGTEETTAADGTTLLRNYIELSKTDRDPSVANDAPMPGDSIVQMGNAIDPTRQNLVVIAAYGSSSPCIYQYQGIDTYALADSKLKTRISPDGNKFCGEFQIAAGHNSQQSLADYVDEHSRLYRIVAETYTNDSGKSMNTRCTPYAVVGGEMIPLTLSAIAGNDKLLRAGAKPLMVGGSLLVLGDMADAVYQGYFELFYQHTYKDGTTSTSLRYTQPRHMSESVAFGTYRLYRNGQLVAEAKVAGPAHTAAYTQAKFEVLDDRISSEVSTIDGKFSQVEQTATGIAQRVANNEGEITAIKQTAGSIVSTVSRQGEAISTIEQRADEISLSVARGDAQNAGNFFHNTQKTPERVEGYRRGDSIFLRQYPIDGISKGDHLTVAFDLDFYDNGELSYEMNGTAQLQLQFVYGGDIIDFVDVDIPTFADRHSSLSVSASFWVLQGKNIAWLPSQQLRMDIRMKDASTACSPNTDAYRIRNLRLVRGSDPLTWMPNASDDIEGKLRDTGIDIRQGEITLQADKVRVKTNSSEVPTAVFDSNGYTTARMLRAVDSQGRKVATINQEGMGEYIMYWPKSGKIRMMMTPSSDQDLALCYYNEDGTLLWSLGDAGMKTWGAEGYPHEERNDLSQEQDWQNMNPLPSTKVHVIIYNGTRLHTIKEPTSATTAEEAYMEIYNWLLQGAWYSSQVFDSDVPHQAHRIRYTFSNGRITNQTKVYIIEA